MKHLFTYSTGKALRALVFSAMIIVCAVQAQAVQVRYATAATLNAAGTYCVGAVAPVFTVDLTIAAFACTGVPAGTNDNNNIELYYNTTNTNAITSSTVMVGYWLVAPGATGAFVSTSPYAPPTTVGGNYYYFVQVSNFNYYACMAGVPLVATSPTVLVSVNPSITGGGVSICPGGTTTLTSSGISTWSSSNTSIATVSATSTTAVTATVTGGTTGGVATITCVSGGCTATTTINNGVPLSVPSPTGVTCGGSTLLTANNGAPTTILTEGFNNGTDRWTAVNDASPTYGPWGLYPNGYISSVAGDVFNSPDNTQFVMINPLDNYNWGLYDPYRGDNGELRSPVFSLAAYSAASLSFQTYYLKYGLTEAYAEVDISTNGGTTWTTIFDYNAGLPSNGGIGAPNGFITEVLSLTPYCGNSNCMLRFNYQAIDPILFEAGDWWAVDNVSVTGTPTTFTPTWSPTTGLWTNAGLTIPYTAGTPLNSVYSAPAGSTVYTASVTYAGCTTIATTTVNLTSALPINGTLSLCQGATTTLTDATTGGTWSASGGGAVVSIVSGTGFLTAAGPGTSTITFTTAGGCTATAIVTVTATPTALTGTDYVCSGSTTTLGETVGGGVWTSGTTAVATVAGGVVSGLGTSYGTSIITYAIGSCSVTATVTVNPAPGPILGTASVCAGLTTNLTDAVGGGTWNSSNTLAATIGLSSGVVTGVAPGGVSTIVYTLPGNCTSSVIVTVNPAPSAIFGVPVVCQGSTTTLTNTVGGGAWTSSTLTVATVGAASGIVTGVGGGTSTIVYTSTDCTPVSIVVTVNPVSPILGATSVCSGLSTTLTDLITGGTWTSSIGTVATVGLTTGVVTGLAGGTTTITDIFPTGCSASITFTVNQSPNAISGLFNLCFGATTTLTDVISGGTWQSLSSGVASIVTGTGFITANSGGTSTIIYTLPDACTATTVVTVSPATAPITGTFYVCTGLSTTLSDVTSGGTWASTTGAATIGLTTGFVTGMVAGTTTIIYTPPTSCDVAIVFTVNASPVAISGPHSLCTGITYTLSDTPGGGTWASSNTGVATIITGTGAITGAGAGTSTIVYTSTAGCLSSTIITVNTSPAPITGTLYGCIGVANTLADATTGGTWSMSDNTVANIGVVNGVVLGLAAGTDTANYILSTGCSANAVYTVNPSPAAIAGTPYICQGGGYIFNDATSGGTWSSSNGNAFIVATSGIAGGITAGPATITYELPTTCYTTYLVTITSAPGPITGPSEVCVGEAISFTDGVGGGAWSETNASGAATMSGDVLTGVSTGVVVVSYTTFSCPPATQAVMVNPGPTAITGVGNLCVGSGTTLTDVTPGGTWSSSNSSVSVSSTGVVSGLSAGSGTYISYTLPSGCYVTAPINVFPSPGPIKGIDSVCPGATVVLTDAVSGGVWSSSDGTIALSFAFSGEDSGVVAGNVTISYTLISGCYTTVPFKVLTPLPASLSILQTPSDTILCSNSPVRLIAVPVNGGNPTYEWERFGSYMQTGDTLIYDPTHGDFITCVMTTHDICAAPAIVSKDVTMNVYPLVAPTVVISTLQADSSSYEGEVYTFFTDVTFGGVGPTYQWYVNGDSIAGATSTTYTTHIYNTNDTVYCIVHGTSPCDTGTIVGQSNTMIIISQGWLSANSLSAVVGNLSLFPNPNTGSFVLSGTLSATTDKEASLEVCDMLGRIVYRGATLPLNGKVRAEIKLDNDVADGPYLLRVSTETGSETFHFVIGK